MKVTMKVAMKITIKVASIKAMNVQKTLLLTLLSSLFFCSYTIGAAEIKAPVHTEIMLEALKGTFTQSKNIKPLKRPFKSAGDFVYLPNKGLLWHTKTPVNSLKLFISNGANNGVYHIDEQGKLKKEAQLDNDFFLALFSADEQKLAKFFTTKKLQHKTISDAACLALIPISDTMLNLFAQINLCTTEVNAGTKIPTKIPTKIELIESKGNKTEIQLQLSSSLVTPEELAYFE